MLFHSSRRKRIQRRPKPQSTLRQFFYGFCIIVVLCALWYGVWHGTRLSFVTLGGVEVVGAETVSSEVVRRTVEQELAGSYFLLVPHRFMYTYPEERILESITGIPRVQTATLERTEENALRVVVSEYRPAALWCAELASSSPCVFVDSEGYAFAPAPPLRGGGLVRYLTPERTPEVGVPAIDSDVLHETMRFKRVLPDRGFVVRHIVLGEDGDVTYLLSGGSEVRATLTLSFEEMLGNLIVVLEDPKFAHLEPGNFHYIDLRFGNKVFVKEEFETAVATSTESEAGEEEFVETEE